MARNYISEIHQIGFSYRQIASDLKVSPTTARNWVKGLTKSTLPYEQVRNYFRRSSYKFMREAGFPSREAILYRRALPEALVTERDWSNMIVNSLYQRWNKKHKAIDDEEHITKEDIRGRIAIGMKRGKSKEEIENY